MRDLPYKIKLALQRIRCFIGHSEFKPYRNRLYCKKCGWCVFKGRKEQPKNIYASLPTGTLKLITSL